jgi:hypothetical protein
MMDAVISASAAMRYLQEYVTVYQAEYERFTAAAPEGGGYPRIPVSPYHYGGELEHKRVVHYAELIRHVDRSAWEPRAAWARAHLDVRRDFATAISSTGQRGGTITIGHIEPPIGPRFSDRLDALRDAANGLELLLREATGEPEAVFHDYLLQYPVLLDVYATAESKPRFHYPPGEAPTGKEYVEPDFVLSYSNRTYKLIELERPSHLLATREGHPRVGVTHAAYQIAEWKDFIAHHYELLRDKYPGISAGYSSMIVISRTEQAAFREISKHRYFDLMRQQLAVDEILTYDDLVTKAKTAISQLEALASSLVTYPPLP